ncbi:MAG: hypothetical protein IJ816_03540 [Alloprevotella sp.]|nr:hypothetical protein [Alloprevotella sp.]
MKPIIKLVLAVLLLLCLADLPYSFYQLVRVAAAVGFAYLSYDYFKGNKNVWGVVFAGLALLFQPFLKVQLDRTFWNAIDIIVALLLISLIIGAFRRK